MLADRLHASILDAERVTLQRSDVQDWAEESHRLAVMRAYVEPEDGWILGQDDIAQNAPEVAEQLRKAGVRLAWTLQAALDPLLEETKDR